MILHILLSNSAAKNREPVCFRAQCVLSTTTTSTATTTVLDVEKLRLPSLEVHSNSVAANRPWTYIGAVGPPTEVKLVPSVSKLTSIFCFMWWLC